MPAKGKKAHPGLRWERQYDGPVVGIDEVGRAPFAGPVVVAAVALPKWRRRPKPLKGLTDSKLLTAPDRERFYERLRTLARIGIGAASTREIDRHNIHRATLKAMERAYENLGVAAEVAIVDGRHAPDLPCPVETVVGGDGTCLSVAAASVVAKVVRDRLMDRLGRRYAGYSWSSNKGYGTDDHYIGLMRLGHTPHHRLSFGPVRELNDDLFVRRMKFVALNRPRADLSPLPLRQDLAAIIDNDDHHIGFAKRHRGRWIFRSVGYDGDGTPSFGAGPCAAWHNNPLTSLDSADLNRVLTGLEKTAASLQT